MTRILGIAAMVAALAGFALFLSTVHAAHGLSSVAFVVGLAALVLLIPLRGSPPATAAAPVAGPAPQSIPRAPSLGARLWTLIAICAGLGLGLFTLRYMYWP